MAQPKPETPGTSKTRPRSPLPRRTPTEDNSSLNWLASYFKKAAVVLAVWAAGYYKFSPSWLLLGLVLYVWNEKLQAAKRNSIATAQEIARDEKAVILARVADLPSWVYFPDVERAEWVNKIVDQLWPYIGEYVRKLLRETVEPKIKANLPAGLESFKFSKIDLGDIPPRIGGIKVYTSQVRRDEIYMDLEINYASDSNLAVQVKGMNFGVRDLTLRGTLRVIFRPLITKTPLIGGMSVFFLNSPELDFNLTNLANALDLPGLSDILRCIIQEQIAEVMVLPNRVPIQIAEHVDIRTLRYPLPQGVLRVRVVEASDVIQADFKLIGKGKSDPYAIVTVGAQTYQTTVINNTLDPVWNQVFEFVIDEREGQVLKLDVNDYDTGSKDDHLGSTTMDIAVICQKGKVEEWLPLENVKSGLVHLQATWLYLTGDHAEFSQVYGQVQSDTKEEDCLHTALLIVNLDSATDLPRGVKTLQEPSPFVLLTVGQVTKESSVRAATSDPCWEQNFRFFVANPNHQSLDVEVRDSKTKKGIGEVSVPLKTLMSAEDMVLDQNFHLKAADASSTLYMTVILRILTPKMVVERTESDHNLATETADEGENNSADSAPTEYVAMETSHPIETAEPASASQADREGTLLTSMEEVIQPFESFVANESEVRLRKSSVVGLSASVEDREGADGHGRIQLTLRYSEARQQLIVVVHKIVHLKPAEGDSKGLADPYVKLVLLPDKSTHKTDVVKKCLNPVYDVMFEWTVRGEKVGEKSVEVHVKNETGLFSSSQKQLGSVLIPLHSMDMALTVTQWFDLGPYDSLQASALIYDM